MIDFAAMVFGMPRALFPALGLNFFHGGAQAVGFLYAAPGAGALIGALTTGWVKVIRRQGRAVIIAVILWGGAVAAFGLIRILWVALILFRPKLIRLPLKQILISCALGASGSMAPYTLALPAATSSTLALLSDPLVTAKV